MLLKTDTEAYPQFCYNCWYYLTVVVSNSSENEFRVFFNQLQDSGTDLLDLQLAQP